MSIKLSILDQSPISEGSNAVESLKHTAQLAKKLRNGVIQGSGFLNTMTQRRLLGHHLKYSSHILHLLRLQSV